MFLGIYIWNVLRFENVIYKTASKTNYQSKGKNIKKSTIISEKIYKVSHNGEIL